MMVGKQRGTFEKRRREIDRQEKQAEKRARRHAKREGAEGVEGPENSAAGFPSQSPSHPNQEESR